MMRTDRSSDPKAPESASGAADRLLMNLWSVLFLIENSWAWEPTRPIVPGWLLRPSKSAVSGSKRSTDRTARRSTTKSRSELSSTPDHRPNLSPPCRSLSSSLPLPAAKKKRADAIHAWTHAQTLIGAPYGLDCSNCPREKRCSTWGDPGSSYKFEGQDLLRRSWDRCPASHLGSAELAVAVSVYVAAETSAIDGWPDQYAEWVEMYVGELRRAIEARRAQMSRGTA